MPDQKSEQPEHPTCRTCAHLPVCHFYPAILMIVEPEKKTDTKNPPPFKAEDIGAICAYWRNSLDPTTVYVKVDKPEKTEIVTGMGL
jgi:hypothetical protein